MIKHGQDGTLEGLPEGATVRLVGVREPTYGSYRGGDPREFFPDPECSSDSERAAHAAACAEWDAGNQVDAEHGRCLVPIETDGNVVIKCSSGAFGLGTYDGERDALEVTFPDGRVVVYL